MANSEYGIAVSQNGVPVATAADYQKVLDSRWKFLEVLLERDFNNIVLPALSPLGTVKYVYTLIMNHGLDDYPAFEAAMTVSGGTQYDPGYPDIVADKSSIYLRQLQTSTAASAFTVSGTFRVYNLAILQDYKAPKEITALESGTDSAYGVRALDGTVPNLGPGDQSKTGYSIDTKKKIISVHRTGKIYLNEYIYRRIKVTAINTSTDTFTFTDNTVTSLKPNGDGTEWVQTGVPIKYAPNDFSTYPSPLVFNGTYYIIKISNTEFKLATSVANAQSGIAIDVTSAGSLPGSVGMQFVSGMDTVTHDVGYPPTFMIAPLYTDTYDPYIGPLMDTILARVQASNTSLKFTGVQSVFAGQYGLVILKDPTEIAS